MFDGLLVGRETEAGDAEIVAAPDKAGSETQSGVVGVYRLFRPIAVGQSGAKTVPERCVIRAGFESSLLTKRGDKEEKYRQTGIKR